MWVIGTVIWTAAAMFGARKYAAHVGKHPSKAEIEYRRRALAEHHANRARQIDALEAKEARRLKEKAEKETEERRASREAAAKRKTARLKLQKEEEDRKAREEAKAAREAARAAQAEADAEAAKSPLPLVEKMAVIAKIEGQHITAPAPGWHVSWLSFLWYRLIGEHKEIAYELDARLIEFYVCQYGDTLDIFTDETHPDHEGLMAAVDKADQMLKLSEHKYPMGCDVACYPHLSQHLDNLLSDIRTYGLDSEGVLIRVRSAY